MTSVLETPARNLLSSKDDLRVLYFTQGGHPLADLFEKVQHGVRLTAEEALRVYESNDLLAIGMLADYARRYKALTGSRPESVDYVYWVRNYHINPTNICEDTCKFCAYKKGPKSPNAYILEIEQILHKIDTYPDKALLREFHVVSGLYREQSLEYYRALFKALRTHFPHVQIKGLTAVELDFFAKVEGISVEQVLDELIAAGLVALPGGGAEVFSPRVRAEVCPDKIPAEEWLHIHGLAHQKGLKSNATMLAGLGETPAERVDHLIQIREQQDKTGGFLSFIPLNCYYENTPIDPRNALTGVENLKNFAISRLVLDNVPHVKAFWIHIGEKISQVGLQFGVSDVDGTVVQEKIAHSAGTESSELLTEGELLHMIRQAGKIPVERDALYDIIQIYDKSPHSLQETPQWAPLNPGQGVAGGALV